MDTFVQPTTRTDVVHQAVHADQFALANLLRSTFFNDTYKGKHYRLELNNILHVFDRDSLETNNRAVAIALQDRNYDVLINDILYSLVCFLIDNIDDVQLESIKDAFQMILSHVFIFYPQDAVGRRKVESGNSNDMKNLLRIVKQKLLDLRMNKFSEYEFYIHFNQYDIILTNLLRRNQNRVFLDNFNRNNNSMPVAAFVTHGNNPDQISGNALALIFSEAWPDRGDHKAFFTYAFDYEALRRPPFYESADEIDFPNSHAGVQGKCRDMVERLDLVGKRRAQVLQINYDSN